MEVQFVQSHFVYFVTYSELSCHRGKIVLLNISNRNQSGASVSQSQNSDLNAEHAMEDWTDIREWMYLDLVNWVGQLCAMLQLEISANHVFWNLEGAFSIFAD